jgi:hypothetical protein
MTADLATVEATSTAIVPAHQASPPTLLAAIIAMASDPSLDAEKLQRLLDMQERLEDREAKRAFNAAFRRLQAKLPRVRKNGVLEYPVHKDKPDGPKRKVAHFAKWEHVHEAIQPILDSEGFALTFRVEQRPGDGGGIMVTAYLLHEGGHERDSGPFPVALDTSGGKNNAQAYGSSKSYGQRYSASAVLNLVYTDEDDDAKGPGPVGRPTGDKLADIERTLDGDDQGEPREARAPAKPAPAPAEMAKWAEAAAKKLITAKTHEALRQVIATEQVRRRVDYLRQNHPDLAEKLTAAESAALQRLGSDPADEATADRAIERFTA